MKKSLFGILAVAVCSIFIFAGCAPAPAADSAAPGGALILGAKGEITDIVTRDGNTSITVDGSNTDSDATYQLLIANMTNKIPVEIDGKQQDYAEGMLNIGDEVEIYLGEGNPVTASEPPMATPDKVVVTERSDDVTSGALNTPDVQTEFDGTITEITSDKDYYLVYVKDSEDSEPVDDLIAVVSGDTTIVSEKLEASGLKPEELKVGDQVTVTTDGRMTFSIPPQSNAQKVVIHDAQAK